MTAVEQHYAHMAPLVGGLAGAPDDVVAQQLIDWLQSSNREVQRLLDHLAAMSPGEPFSMMRKNGSSALKSSRS